MSIPSLTYGSDSHPTAWTKNGTTDDYEVVKNVVLQATNIKDNNNKFYSLEIHKNSKDDFRLFSHYGRTDDLEKKGASAGVKECRYAVRPLIESEYEKIIKSKTKKGYAIVNLAKSNIGSDKARGKSVGVIDQKTMDAMKAPVKKSSRKKKGDFVVDAGVSSFIEAIYKEAGQALTQKANVTITADGFSTPLGVLTIGQVDDGFSILGDIRKAIQNSEKNKTRDLSSKFYTTIPHRLGRSREAAEAAIISSIDKSDEVEETLQLMKDMLNVNKSGGTNLFATNEINQKIDALKTKIECIAHDDPEWIRIKNYIKDSQSKAHNRNVIVKNIYRIERNGEKAAFNPNKLSNVRELFHGTRNPNLVGILTRGLLMPNVASRHGAVITGAMFGPGIYFADQSTKSVNYCGGQKSHPNNFMFLADVALGKQMKYKSAQSGLKAPPAGYDSVMGEASVDKATWNYLVHNEYIIFNGNQQKLSYVVEFGS